RKTPNLPLITVDEVLFNHAEASLEKLGTFNADAKTKLISIIDNLNFTTAATTSYKNEVNNAATKAAGLTVLLKLKRSRFFAEGVRFFDSKRHKLPITHNFEGTNFSIDGTSPNDYVIKLPVEEIQFNPDSNQ